MLRGHFRREKWDKAHTVNLEQLALHGSTDGLLLLKQVRTHLIETARPVLEAMIHEATGVKALTMHHDISTITGEEVVIFTLAESPDCREAKKK